MNSPLLKELINLPKLRWTIENRERLMAKEFKSIGTHGGIKLESVKCECGRSDNLTNLDPQSKFSEHIYCPACVGNFPKVKCCNCACIKDIFQDDNGCLWCQGCFPALEKISDGYAYESPAHDDKMEEMGEIQRNRQ